GRTGETPWPGAPRRADEGRGDHSSATGWRAGLASRRRVWDGMALCSAVPAPRRARLPSWALRCPVRIPGGEMCRHGTGNGRDGAATRLDILGGDMSRYQAIALDMDGTLLNRDHKISSATRAALAQARAHDIKVLLVTGRHFM